MHHSDCTPRIPTVTAEEAVKMSWLWSSSQTLKEVSQLFNAITEVPNEFSLTGAYRFMGLITALWNAGRVQGIREERAGGSARHRPSNSDRNTL